MAPTCSAGPRDIVDGNGQGGSATDRHGRQGAIGARAADPEAEAITAISDTAAAATAKRALRLEAIKRRDALDDGQRSAAARRTLLHLMGQLRLAPESVVAAFWPIGRELDTRPLLESLAALGVTTCLPRMIDRAKPLQFCRFRPGDALVEGAMRVLEPSVNAPPMQPTIVVVPMLAFDESGYRLGYGGGFYDRTLPTIAARQIVGIAFEAQRVPAIPHGLNDVRLDTIVTESGVHHFP